LLPAIDGIFSDNWRIRQSTVQLLGDLLFKVAGTSVKAILEDGSDDEGAIVEVLGRAKHNQVLAAVYMVCSDVSLTVHQVYVIFCPFVGIVELGCFNLRCLNMQLFSIPEHPFFRASVFHARLR